MDSTGSKNDLFATQYTGSPAMMDAVREILEETGAPLLRADGRHLYALLRLDMGDVLRKRVKQVSHRFPDDVLRIRWCSAARLDDAPDIAFVRDGAFIYADSRDVSIAWTGQWIDMEAREAVNALLEEFCGRLGRIRGMESALVSLQSGDAQVQAAAAGFRAEGAGGTRGMRSEYFDKLLAAVV